jgi:hypothetical protein
MNLLVAETNLNSDFRVQTQVLLLVLGFFFCQRLSPGLACTCYMWPTPLVVIRVPDSPLLQPPEVGCGHVICFGQ